MGWFFWFGLNGVCLGLFNGLGRVYDWPLMVEQTPNISRENPSATAQAQPAACAHPPVVRLGVALVASCLGAVGVVLLTRVAGVADVPSSLLGAGCVLASGIVALVVLWSVAKSPEVNVGVASLAFSGVRLFGSLALGLVVLVGLSPERSAFVYTFLFAAIGALVLETIVLRRWAAL